MEVNAMPGLILDRSEDEGGEIAGDVNGDCFFFSKKTRQQKKDSKTSYVRYKLFKYDRFSFRRHRKFSDRYFSHYSFSRGEYFHFLLAPIEGFITLIG